MKKHKKNPTGHSFHLPESPFHVSDDAIVDYLEQSQEHGTDSFLEALSTVAKSKGMEHIAHHAGVSRANLYKALQAGAKPRYDTIEKVLSSMGIGIQFTTKANTRVK